MIYKLLTLSILLLAAPAYADTLATSSANTYVTALPEVGGQEITNKFLGLSGKLSSVDMYFEDNGDPDGDLFDCDSYYLFIATPTTSIIVSPNQLVKSSLQLSDNGWISWDVSGYDVYLTPDVLYKIGTEAISVCVDVGAATTSPTAAINNYPQADFAMRLYMEDDFGDPSLSRIRLVQPYAGSFVNGTRLDLKINYENNTGYNNISVALSTGAASSSAIVLNQTIESGIKNTRFIFDDMATGTYSGYITMYSDTYNYTPLVYVYSVNMAGTSTSDYFGLIAASELLPPSETDFNVSSCEIGTTFNLYLCVWETFIPSKTQIAALTTSLYENILNRAPWGYATRAVTIIIDDTASTTYSLPSLVYTVPEGLPAAGATVDLSPWGELAGTGSMLAEAVPRGSSVPFMVTVLPYWEWGFKLLFAFWLMYRVIGVGKGLAAKELESGAREDRRGVHSAMRVLKDNFTR